MDILNRLGNVKTERHLEPSDISTRGSGITKRGLEKVSKAYDKQAKQALEKGGAIAAKEAAKEFQRALDETTAALEEEAKAKNIILDPSQLQALKGILKNQVCCLIGAPGTGKTTLEKMVISNLAKKFDLVYVVHKPELDEETGEEIPREENEEDREKTPAIAVAAYTGRAAQQSAKAIGTDYGVPIQTIHRLLGYAPVMEPYEKYDEITGTYFMSERRVFRPTYGLSLKLPYKVYILDEASMIPINLFNELIDAIDKNARIILVGDIHQLPPVHGKSVLGYALQKWPTFELTTIHRQAEGNSIISNCHRILKGLPPLKADNFHLFRVPPHLDGSMGFATFVRQITQHLYEKKRFDPYRDVVIVPNSNEEILYGAPELNEHFVALFNPEKTVNGIIINKRMKIHTGTGEAFFAIGDKVMMGQNINTVNPPITNGMMGIVENITLNGKYDQKRAQVTLAQLTDNSPRAQIKIDFSNFDAHFEAAEASVKKEADESMDQRQASHLMTIKFESGQTHICQTAGDYRKISYGYAITCHKSQGGEYPNIIIALHSSSKGNILTQEWLLTAVSRARNNVYLLFNDVGLKRAITVQKIKGKTLAEKIRSYVIEAHTDDITLTNDPWNVDRKKFPILFNQKEV